MARIVDEGITQGDSRLVWQVGLQMVAVACIGVLAGLSNVYASSRVAVGFATDLRQQLFDKIQRFSFVELDTFRPSSLITRLTGDITKLQALLQVSLRLLLRAPLMMMLALFFVIRTSADLGWIVGLSIPILAVMLYLILTKGFPLFVAVQERVDKLNAVVRENLINIRVVKSFVREDFEEQKFHRSVEDLQEAAVRASNMVVTIFPAMQLVMNLSVILILWFGGRKVMNQHLQIGELISVVNYLIQILISLMMLSVVFVMSVRASASSARVTEVLDAPLSLTYPCYPQAEKQGIRQGEITFRNVSFRYPQSENDILKGIDLSIKAGETVAVIGATGAGKSTLLQLIPRLYDVTEGQVLINGIDIRNFTADELHTQVAMVLQQNELFAGTVAENLRWGNAQASQQELEWAARTAQADEFIATLENGYDTLLGRNGINVSGGQKQRLCIARALLMRPRILLLDDSTSAVDTRTERALMQSITQELPHTTILIVTQRIANTQTANRIVVLDDGAIESIGTHHELLLHSPIYKEFYLSQQTYTED